VRADVGGKPTTLLFIALCAAALFFFDPATARFYPHCLFRTVFGFPCPGCGSLRALHQVLHGNLLAAWELNRTLFIAVPVAAIASFVSAMRRRAAPPS
jgi:hypothetical protein